MRYHYVATSPTCCLQVPRARLPRRLLSIHGYDADAAAAAEVTRQLFLRAYADAMPH